MVIINDDVKEYPIYEMEKNPFMFQITNQIDYPKIWNGKLSQPDRWLSHYIMFYEPWWWMVIINDVSHVFIGCPQGSWVPRPPRKRGAGADVGRGSVPGILGSKGRLFRKTMGLKRRVLSWGFTMNMWKLTIEHGDLTWFNMI